VILAVDSDGDGSNDHNVVVFGYDNSSQKLLIHDGWESTDDMRWIDFSGVANGHEFGIVAATFVRPPDEMISSETTQILQLVNDGYGTGASYSGVIGNDGRVSLNQSASDSNLGSNTVGIATADGHTYYQLYNDGNGSAKLYTNFSYGDGTFNWIKLSDDSGLSNKTLDLATADGKTFYQLLNDGHGTAALYEATLLNNGTFSHTLLNSDCGLGSDTIGFSTTDGITFQQTLYDGYGGPSFYECTLNANGTFSFWLKDANSALSNSGIGLATWTGNPLPDPDPVDPVDPQPEPTNTINGTDGNDYLVGTDANDLIDLMGGQDVVRSSAGSDTIVGSAGSYDQVDYEGRSSDYKFTTNPDGTVKVEKPGGTVDTLTSVDGFWFIGEEVWKPLEDVLEAPTGPVTGQIITGTTGDDYLRGTLGNDTIDGGAGIDVIQSSDGNDIIDGGGIEYDQIDYSGNSTDYTFTSNADGSVSVAGPSDKTDTITDIDGIWFAGDGKWSAVEDLITGGVLPDRVINGTDGNDYLDGTAGNDTINAGTGLDVIKGSKGDDIIKGGDAGYNQVDYSGSSSDFVFAKNADGSITATGTETGTDTLYDIGGVWFETEEAWYDIEDLYA